MRSLSFLMDPIKYTHPDITEKLTRWGGRNRFGQPNWRIIRAERHLVQRAGMWTEFAEDTEAIRPTGKDFKFETRHIQPDSVKVGTFWVPLYPCKGWILERWFPSSTFGSRQQWESALSQDGETPMMGPYPVRGEYFILLGPWERIPNLEEIRRSISIWENDPSHLHGKFDEEKLVRTMQQTEQEEEEREKATNAAVYKNFEYAYQDYLKFVKGNPSLNRARNAIASREGISSHI